MTETPEPTQRPSLAAAPRGILVLGANGPSGRRVVQQALDRGLSVAALTRHPEDFPLRHDRLRVIGGDATVAAVMDEAVAGCDAVISVIGAAYTRRAVAVYSTSARLAVRAMHRGGIRRILVVSSAEVAAETALQGRFLTDRVLYPLLRRVVGRTVYDDMERMEAVVRGTDLAWTIVRPPGLSNRPGTGYTAAETRVVGMFCARDDLAAFLLDELGADRFVRRVAAVATPGLRVSGLQTLREEVLKR
jgi:putative NADH-flavin reductase